MGVENVEKQRVEEVQNSLPQLRVRSQKKNIQLKTKHRSFKVSIIKIVRPDIKNIFFGLIKMKWRMLEHSNVIINE